MGERRETGSGFLRAVATVFSVAMIALGVALIVRTVAAGGSGFSIGLLLGLLFVAAGAGRLYVARRAP